MSIADETQCWQPRRIESASVTRYLDGLHGGITSEQPNKKSWQLATDRSAFPVWTLLVDVAYRGSGYGVPANRYFAWVDAALD